MIQNFTKKIVCGGGGGKEGWGLTSPKSAHVVHQSVLIFPQSAAYFLYAAWLRWWWEWGAEEVPLDENIVNFLNCKLVDRRRARLS